MTAVDCLLDFAFDVKPIEVDLLVSRSKGSWDSTLSIFCVMRRMTAKWETSKSNGCVCATGGAGLLWRCRSAWFVGSAYFHVEERSQVRP
jgi:hypothetical protein